MALKNRSWRGFACGVACVLATISALAADPCEVPDVGAGTVSVPPDGCEYLTGDQVHMIMDGLPAGTHFELAPIHKDFICREQNPNDKVCGLDDGVGGKNEFFSSVAEFSLTGHETGAETCISSMKRKIPISVFCQTHTNPRGVGPVQSFDTEMMGLQGQITGDPDFDLLRVTAGTSFGLPSPGHTTLTKLPSGSWAVDSFFDITYRIDFIGAPGSCIAGRSGSTTGTIRMVVAGEPKPPVGAPVGTGWGVAAAISGMLVGGSVLLLRRKAELRTAA